MKLASRKRSRLLGCNVAFFLIHLAAGIRPAEELPARLQVSKQSEEPLSLEEQRQQREPDRPGCRFSFLPAVWKKFNEWGLGGSYVIGNFTVDDSVDERKCKGACCKAENAGLPSVFRVGNAQAKLVEYCDEWKMFATSTCKGAEIGNVTVLTRPHAQDPVDLSSAVIVTSNITRAADSASLFVCCVGNRTLSEVVPTTWCWAEVPWESSFRLGYSLVWLEKHLLGGRLDWLEDVMIDATESGVIADAVDALILMALALLVLSLCRVVLELREVYCKGESQAPPWPVTIPKRDGFWRPSFQAWGQMMGIVATISTVLSLCLRVLLEQDQPELFVITVLWPIVFGAPGVVRLMVAHCKAQLTTAGVLHGVCLSESRPHSVFGPLVIGLVVLILCLALADHGISSVLFVLGALLGPLWSISRSTFSTYTQERRLQGSEMRMSMRGLVAAIGWKSALNRPHVRSSLGEIPEHEEVHENATDSEDSEETEEVEVRESPVSSAGSDAPPTFSRVWSENVRRERTASENAPLDASLREGHVKFHNLDAFICSCSKGIDALEALEFRGLRARNGESGAVELKDFSIFDLRWQGRAVHRLTGSTSAIWNLPVLMVLFLILVLQSVVWGGAYSTQLPLLWQLTVSSGVLVPEFQRYVTEYDLVVKDLEQEVTVYVKTRAHWNEVSFWPYVNTSAVGSSALNIDLSEMRVPYPLTISVRGFAGRIVNYNLNIIRLVRRVSSMRLHGEFFQRCVPWSEAEYPSVISYPTWVHTPAFDISFAEFAVGLPISADALPNSSSLDNEPSLRTVYQKFNFTGPEDRQRHCLMYCNAHPRCLYDVSAPGGCFFTMGPSAQQCNTIYDWSIRHPLPADLKQRLFAEASPEGRVCFGACSARSQLADLRHLHFVTQDPMYDWQMPLIEDDTDTRWSMAYFVISWFRDSSALHSVYKARLNNGTDLGLIHAVAYVEGMDVVVKRSGWYTHEITVELPEYDPLMQDQKVFCLHLAIGVKDHAFELEWPDQYAYEGDCHALESFEDLGVCGSSARSNALSACGGPWQAPPMVLQLNPWELNYWMFSLVPKDHTEPNLASTTFNVSVTVVNSENEEVYPDDNLLHNLTGPECHMYLGAMKPDREYNLEELIPWIFKFAAQNCVEVHFEGPEWYFQHGGILNGDIGKFLVWGMNGLPQVYDIGLELLAWAELNDDFDQIMDELNVTVDAHGGTWTGGLWPYALDLRLSKVINTSWETTGRLVHRICSITPLRNESTAPEADQIDEVLIQAIARQDVVAVRAIVDCIKERGLETHPDIGRRGGPLSMAPVDVMAYEYEDPNTTLTMLEDVLEVYHPSMQKTTRRSLVSEALLLECGHCVKVLLDRGLDSSHLDLSATDYGHFMQSLIHTRQLLAGHVEVVNMQLCALDDGILNVTIRYGLWQSLGDKVTVLNLRDNNLLPVGMDILATALRALPNLTSLLLESNELWTETDETFPLLQAIGELSHLQRLGLSNTHMSEAIGSKLVQVLPGLPMLRHLYLNQNKIRSMGVAALVAGVANLTRLERVHVGDNNIGGPGALRLLKSLQKSAHTLHDLVLRANNINFDSALRTQIADVLVHNLTKLETLDISDNVMSSKSAAALVEVLSAHAALRMLKARNYPEAVRSSLLSSQRSAGASFLIVVD